LRAPAPPLTAGDRSGKDGATENDVGIW
jgi:hypothetical protein